MKDPVWHVDYLAAKKADRLGLELRTEEVSVGDIDAGRSQRFNARTKPIDNARVQRLLAALLAGYPFTMIVVVRRGKRFLILGGNHRFAAFLLAGLKTVRAHVVASDDGAMCATYAQTLNVGIGEEESEDGVLEQAVNAVSGGGLTAAQASKIFLCSASAIDNRLQQRGIRDKAASLGIDLNGASGATVQKLYAFRNQEPVMQKVMLLVRDGATSSNVEDIKRIVKDHRTEASKLVAIEKYAADVLEAKRHATAPTPRAPRSQIKGCVNRLRGLFGDKRTARGLGLDAAALADIKALHARLAQILKDDADV